MEKKPEKHSKTQKTDKNGTKTGKSKFKYIKYFHNIFIFNRIRQKRPSRIIPEKSKFSKGDLRLRR